MLATMKCLICGSISVISALVRQLPGSGAFSCPEVEPQMSSMADFVPAFYSF